jgi:hypothetical protein
MELSLRYGPQIARQSRAAVTSSFLILPSYFPIGFGSELAIKISQSVP